MSEAGGYWASGAWQVSAGKADEFVDRWKGFLEWTRAENPGFRWARLIRDRDDDHHFISFASWSDAGARDAWRQKPGFSEHAGGCRALCDEFRGGDFDDVVTIAA